MRLVDALVTVANRGHVTWALTVDHIVLLRRSVEETSEYVVRELADPPEELWTAVIATAQPDEVVTETLEAALAWIAAHGHYASLVSDRWLTTAHGAA
jgi:hypothetical protein